MKLTIGQYLRQLREERGISLEQLAQATRINPTYLRALENDEMYLLPSAVQGRGYLRLIAGTYNIDPQPLLAAFPDKEVLLPSGALEGESPEEVHEEVKSPPPTGEVELTLVEETPEIKLQAEVSDIRASLPDTFVSDSEETSISPPPAEGSSTFIFSEIGRQFRTQREALGISLEDAERFTRLKSRYLQTIEEGRLDQLPSLVQGRGMLRNYAEFLNLDSETVLLQFAEGLQRRRLEHLAATESARPSVSSTVRAPNRLSVLLRRWMTPDLLVGGFLFLILLVFVIWGTARVSGIQDQEVQATPPSISELLLNTADASGINNQTSTPSPSPAAVQNNGIALPPEGEEGEEVQVTGEVPLSTDPVQVYVIANQRVWLRVVVDNRVAFEGRTIPGSAYPFTGKQAIELISGNAAGVQIVYNQNNLGNLGASGEVLRLIFTAEGTVVPTLLFTSTPAPTLPPTFTPQPTLQLPTPTVTPLVP
ncbi:MAG: RodZ domain-containing protein [Chloroflexota bacterium]|nr:MAG: hypothetical protein KatS3mg047_0266 [Bellilinea sp.]